jgi:hypothetical protein
MQARPEQIAENIINGSSHMPPLPQLKTLVAT